MKKSLYSDSLLFKTALFKKKVKLITKGADKNVWVLLYLRLQLLNVWNVNEVSKNYQSIKTFIRKHVNFT